MNRSPARGQDPWWKSGVLYQIYPRSFADSDGDGVGDLPGIIERLDYLQWLGVDGIWLSPITVSPNADWGYDVADYVAVEPELGTMADVDRLIAEANRRDIRVLMDLVPNHTSEQHPWFVDSRSSRTSEHRSWYVWADPRSDGSPPNNWVSSFGGPAWTLDDATGQYYLHNHLVQQPDLNWWDDEVRRAFDDVMTVLARPGGGGLPHRRVQHDHQGRRAAGQPSGHRGGLVRGAALRPALGVQRQPARGPRGDPAVAGVDRSLPWGPVGGGNAGGAHGEPGPLLRERARRAAAGLQLPVHQLHRWRTGPCAPSSRPPSGTSRPGPGRRGRDRITTCPGSPPGGPGATTPKRGWPWSCCCACGEPRSSTRATRSDSPTPSCPTS